MLKLKSAILLLIFCLSCPCSSLPLFLSSCRIFEPYFDLLTELLSISFCIVSIVGIFQYTQKTCYHLLVSVFNTFSEVWKSFTNKMWLLFLPHVSNIIFNIIWCSCVLWSCLSCMHLLSEGRLFCSPLSLSSNFVIILCMWLIFM